MAAPVFHWKHFPELYHVPVPNVLGVTTKTFLIPQQSIKRVTDHSSKGVVAKKLIPICCTEECIRALAGVAQWIKCCLQTKGLQVQFQVRAHAWVSGQVPDWGHVKSNTLSFLSFSLPRLITVSPSDILSTIQAETLNSIRIGHFN